MENKNVAETVISLEKAALDRWGKGDPSGFLEISADEVCYFDPFLERRIDNKEELIRLYENFRGKIQIEKYELINPKVQILNDAAVLTFNYVSYSGEQANRWNCTEVYKYSAGKWQIIQTHWSFTKPLVSGQ